MQWKPNYRYLQTAKIRVCLISQACKGESSRDFLLKLGLALRTCSFLPVYLSARREVLSGCAEDVWALKMCLISNTSNMGTKLWSKFYNEIEFSHRLQLIQNVMEWTRDGRILNHNKPVFSESRPSCLNIGSLVQVCACILCWNYEIFALI